MQELEPLDRMKLCIIGEPGVGKSRLRVSLSRGVFQAAFLPDQNQSDEEQIENSAGIVIGDVQIGSNNFTIWDFAGQLENYVTHQLFMTTESTMYIAVINLCDDPDQQRHQLMKWLKLIKVRNIGLLQYVSDPQYAHYDTHPLAQPTIKGPDIHRGATFSVRYVCIYMCVCVHLFYFPLVANCHLHLPFAVTSTLYVVSPPLTMYCHLHSPCTVTSTLYVLSPPLTMYCHLHSPCIVTFVHHTI